MASNTNTSPAGATPLSTEGDGQESEQTVMTEFVIAITAFCSLIFIFCVAFVFVFAYCKHIHREEEEDEGEYIGDEESLPGSSQQSYNNYPRKHIRGHLQGHPQGHHLGHPQNQLQGHHLGHAQGHHEGHRNHVLSVWDTYPLYYVREKSLAEKFWESEAVRNPRHIGPTVIY
ncbi:uncharacterized protein LOC121424897 isoform X1 [Lytechinus variegatus]|uniref:uncharacterized protein LOC121424897 isoform X1 n=1 Tax=Lytechinus variegatus TaxID=7654 RepID=UPI001BB2785B|nr:uncharacterized protein LOC121424897 isoform X1 [Lytechinus variegatus]